MRKFELYFYGYTWEEYAFQISSLKGIFVIYQGRLDSEGFIDIKEILYVGYHNGIVGLYENGVINSIKHYLEPGNRLFLSYAETPTDDVGDNLASIIASVVKPKYNPKGVRNDFLDTQIVNKGYCKLIPENIII